MTDLLVAAALRAATAIASAQGDDADFAAGLSTAATVPDMASIDVVRLGVIAVAATVAAAVSAVTAFGMAVTFHAIAHGVAAAGLAAIDAGAAVAYLMCMAIPAFWPLAVAHRRHIWWGLAGVLFVPSAVFTYVGTLLLVGQPPAVLRPLLGASMLAIALWETARSRPLPARTASEAPNGLTASSDPVTTSDPFCEVIVDSGVDDDDDADSMDEREARRPLLSPPLTATGRPTSSSLTVGVVVLAVVCGVASGLLGGVLCLHGPPLMVFAAVVPMPVERMYAPPPQSPQLLLQK